jgi:hypothetical protein
MSSGIPLNSARRTKTYTAAQLVDPDGIKTSFATVAAPVVLTSADWSGTAVASGGFLDLPRSITITLGNNASQYSTGNIVITGFRGGRAISVTVNAASINGNETLRPAQLFDQITGVSLPTMGGTGGTILIGVQDIGAPSGTTFTGVEVVAATTLNLGYGHDDAYTQTDSIPITAASIEVIRPIAAKRIMTSSALAVPTAVGLTVYLP